MEIARKKAGKWLRKGNLKKETESLLIAVQVNAVRTNYIKAKIANTQQNCKSWLCGDRDETDNHIISECSKLAQKEYKTRYDWVGKVIHWELCKRLKFDHAPKWYMHKSKFVLENETHSQGRYTWDELEIVTMRKFKERNCIFSNSSTK